MKNFKTYSVGITMAAILFASCSSMNRSQKGAIIGAAGGAAVGAVIGKAANNTALGTVIGATVGGVAGTIIGKKMDKQAEEIKDQVAGAKVERVGEGIVVEFNNAVLFGYDQSSLSDKAKSTLDDLIGILNKYPDTNLEIQGHTDNTGTEQYNQGLSERRAGSVANYLSSHNVAYARLKTVGFGESYPKYDNTTEAGRSQNRRVEFLITANDKMKADAQQEANN